jgi:hypothetical protein
MASDRITLGFPVSFLVFGIKASIPNFVYFIYQLLIVPEEYLTVLPSGNS